MEEKKVCPGCCHKTKDRPEKEYKDLINRLSKLKDKSGEFEGWLKKARIVRIF